MTLPPSQLIAIGPALPTSAAQQIEERITLLQESLEKQLPEYKNLLRTIHSILQKDEELVHILKEEQIGVVLAALQKHKGVVIAAVTEKAGKREASKKLAATTVEDI